MFMQVHDYQGGEGGEKLKHCLQTFRVCALITRLHGQVQKRVGVVYLQVIVARLNWGA